MPEYATPTKPNEPIRPPTNPPRPQPQPQPPHKPPEPEPEEPSEKRIALTKREFQELIATAIAEGRKPVRDERAEERQKRWREHNRMMRKDRLQVAVAHFNSCNHMHLPGSVLSGCSVIAWATQSDGVKRGHCPHCGTDFSPIRKECISDEIWKAYANLVRIPTHPGGHINSIFMSA